MRTIVCTNGTSIAGGCPSLRGLSATRTRYDDDAADLEREVRDKLRSTARADLARVSAETNSLARLNLRPDDQIVLLATDTAEGRVCAQAVARTLLELHALSAADVRVVRIEGLQVHDADRLRGVGLPRLMEAILAIVELPERREGGIVLNQTGGFKGIVPFLTIAGMLFGLKTVYLFEGSSALIELPPLPIAIDQALFARAATALVRVKREGAIPVSLYHHLIEDFEPGEQPLFASFVESDGKSVTISPLASILTEIEAHGPRNLALSESAAKCLRAARGQDRVNFNRLLLRLSSALWRGSHRHRFQTTDLEVYKPGDTAHRAACVTEGDVVYVCELYADHHLYTSDLPKRRRADYDLGTFAPYVPEALAEADLNVERDAARRIRELEQEVAMLKAALEA